MITVFIDGMCAEKNPNGVGTYACIIRDGKKQIYRGAGFIGEGQGMSSNVSEYRALLDALDTLERKCLSYREIIVYTDSQVLAKQMSGEWKAVKGYYLEFYLKAKAMRDRFANLKFQWIPREENEEADAITEQVYKDYCRATGKTPKYPQRRG
jgi:ribonuclease HI